MVVCLLCVLELWCALVLLRCLFIYVGLALIQIAGGVCFVFADVLIDLIGLVVFVLVCIMFVC